MRAGKRRTRREGDKETENGGGIAERERDEAGMLGGEKNRDGARERAPILKRRHSPLRNYATAEF